MADSHPFSNAGLGMFGADAALARQAATPEGASEKTKKFLGGLTAGAIDAVGLKDFFDKIGGGGESQSGVAPPVGSVAPANPAYALQPVVPISQQGISPMRMPNARPDGVGLNAAPAGAMNPFQFQTNPQPPVLPDDEHKNQVKSAWS
jgi:hypothetical protein